MIKILYSHVGTMIISIEGTLKLNPSVYSTFLYKTCVYFNKIIYHSNCKSAHSIRMFFILSTHSICLVGLYILFTIADTLASM